LLLHPNKKEPFNMVLFLLQQPYPMPLIIND